MQPFDHSLKQRSLYRALGGAPAFDRLVTAFYRLVQADPDLAPVFPADINPVRAKQLLFLTQFAGGPAAYSAQYGPPMLRARHLHVPITPKRAKAWLGCMQQAMDEAGFAGPARDELFTRLSMTAMHMVNRPE